MEQVLNHFLREQNYYFFEFLQTDDFESQVQNCFSSYLESMSSNMNCVPTRYLEFNLER